jgi:hypothetical protein
LPFVVSLIEKGQFSPCWSYLNGNTRIRVLFRE